MLFPSDRSAFRLASAINQSCTPMAHLARPPQAAGLLRLTRSRWNIVQYFQSAKTDLGLDHYEGRGWRGFHHHLLFAVLAYLFVTAVHLREKKLLV